MPTDVRTCGRCGRPRSDRFDEGSGNRDGSWSPRPDRPPPPPEGRPGPRPGGGDRPRAEAPGRRGAPESPPPPAGTVSVVEGQVHGARFRTEQQRDTSEAVCTFRVERYDDSGNRVQLIPVEMRGYRVEGSISDGDWVRGTGRMKSGTFRMTEVENLTTGADVRAKGIPRIALVFVFVLFALILAFMIWGAVQMFSTG
ncbi:hypothetical protein [Streptomyces sp. NPDC014622]|uniref:hypothetical protein n=1 Tax=Streptomyces sp. NPDC014622 TaxID=3364874 RepID=UPI0036F8A3DF